MTSLKEGDQAPIFKGISQTGETIDLGDYKGQKVALFFYPKDNTPACTKEACNLRDNFGALKKAGIEVIGVSPDNEKSHQRFIEKFELPFNLIADTERELANLYEVWGPKQFMGREIIGIHRTTFLIDEEGKIEKVIRKVVTKDHANQILN